MKPRHYLLSLAAFGLLMMIPVAWAITGWSIIGVLVEWFGLNARLSGDYGLYNEFFDWFVKPVYWLYVFGIPCSLVVGLLSHFVAVYTQKRKALALGESS